MINALIYVRLVLGWSTSSIVHPRCSLYKRTSLGSVTSRDCATSSCRHLHCKKPHNLPTVLHIRHAFHHSNLHTTAGQ
jgi:hypothetical protein